MKKIAITFSISVLVIFMSFGQDPSTTGDEILKSISQREIKMKGSIYSEFPVRNVGPVVQGGRITDIAVNPRKAKQYYIAFASGGIFKTENNGITFVPIFDNQGALTVGDISISPSDPNILWVGTGENNSSRSSYAGSGVYKSMDAGESWDFMGLESTEHIGRIVIHPENPDIIWVASMGNLYSHNSQRGIFKTTDGGKSWVKTLFVNDSTGVIDLVIHPSNPDILWASSWERTRKAWNFKGHGPGSAIYKSTDGGEHWEKKMSGIGDLDFMGRIGLDLCLEKPNVMYALIDNQFETKTEKEIKEGELTAGDFVKMTKEDFLALDDEKLNKYLKDNNFPEKYSAKVVKGEVSKDKYAPDAIANYLGNANDLMVETKVKGSEIYRSDDFGETWEKTHDYHLEGVYFTYGYYFGEIRVSPTDEDVIYISGVPLIKSSDGGKTFAETDTIGGVHSDHQAMWIDPEDSDHIILGNDGGLYMTYDGGAAWNHINNISAGQFYTVNVDMEKPYNIYGGLQDNGILFGSSKSIPNVTKNWERLFGGDGMFVIPDPRNHKLVYVGYQFGNYYRINTETNKRKYITPAADIGEPGLRFNWRTPVLMSTHNSDILYMGAQKLFRSMDKAESWTAISDDLTKDLPNGNVPYSTISCVAESKLKFGLLYVGTDDGNIQVSKDGGNSWNLISGDLPSNKWISSIYPSTFNEETVFASLTGYREDDFASYVYRSDDFGASWNPINGDIQYEAVNVILEDLEVPGLLFLGTDHGTYVSLNNGDSWDLIPQIPNVSSYDMIIHPRDHELIIATHGRSMYVLPIESIRNIARQGKEQEFMVVEPGDVRYSERWGKKRFPYLKDYNPEMEVLYFVPENITPIKMEVFQDDVLYFEKDIKPESVGFNTFSWNLKIHPLIKNKKMNKDELVFVEKGDYTMKLIYGSQTKTIKIVVK